jgi:catechol-2,3-dioxygenase
MPAELKAVVFRTSKLKETKDFFINELGFIIKESSITHFVLQAKGIRILFVETGNDFNVELYVRKRLNAAAKNKLTLHEDPNNIKIIISDKS